MKDNDASWGRGIFHKQAQRQVFDQDKMALNFNDPESEFQSQCYSRS